MKLIIQLLLTAIVVLVLAEILPGVGVDAFTTSIIVAAVLALLNVLVKPILVFLTLPATLITFGLFLLVINAVIILLVDYLIPGFSVDGFWWALLFSLLLTISQSILYSLTEK
ncbi:phage holin family protein [Planktosalinus lacus]|uniref:Membrane protein n=1 Tax=Planktosalinus lacus TaxID=1526573 RepID=A0A8J2VBR6_9FLAO|nr:phage holin family protein [Planktosalinus lacus]GGE01677.1 membrane protein [Planktosalinus lacus]